MIVLIHVIIAVTSIVQTSYLFFKPSTHALRISYLLVALTMISGFYLVATQPVSIQSTCTSGLVYLAIVGVGIAGATRKIAAQQVRSKDRTLDI
jgi:hypothetical protein